MQTATTEYTCRPQNDAWAHARARLELYLSGLADMPAMQRQQLLEAAIARAAARSPAVPLPAAMSALHELLENAPSSEDALEAPSLNRGGMVPEVIERSPLRFIVSELLRPMLLGTARLAIGHRHLLLVFSAGAAGLLIQQI
jgi:hypothetical protein